MDTVDRCYSEMGADGTICPGQPSDPSIDMMKAIATHPRWKEVRHLILAHIHTITELPTEMDHIEILRAPHNVDTIPSMPNLTMLTCHSGIVSKIGDDMPKLEILSIILCPRIKSLPRDMPKLRRLTLQITPISQLGYYPELETICLSDTQITWIPDYGHTLNWVSLAYSNIRNHPNSEMVFHIPPNEHGETKTLKHEHLHVACARIAITQKLRRAVADMRARKWIDVNSGIEYRPVTGMWYKEALTHYTGLIEGK